MTSAWRCIGLLLMVGSACQPAMTRVPGPPTVLPSTTPAKTSAPSLRPPPPTPTATAAPAPRLFKEEFDGGAPYWIFMQTAADQSLLDAETRDGSLRLDLAVANEWAYAVYKPHSYADVRVDARVEFGAGGQGAAGLICRYEQGAGWYEFNIYPDQTYTVLFGQWLTEGVARYTPLVIAGSEKILPSVNEIGLVCEADVLTPYINGVQMRKRQEKTYVLTDGNVGVSAAAFEEAPLVISYDWISVSNP